MMDRICVAVLDRICSLTAPGKYAVLSREELAEGLLDGENVGGSEIERALAELKDGEYVDVKYSGGDLFCVALLKKYEEVPPTPVQAEVTEKPPRKGGLPLFLWAFAGGAAGSLLVTLAAALINA